MVELISFSESEKPEKKYKVVLSDNGRQKTIHFGSRGADDFTLTKDEEQKKRYIARHEAKEDWTASGIKTAGFWARWILWNLTSVRSSLADVKKRFNL
jgi:hypothetical protein